MKKSCRQCQKEFEKPYYCSVKDFLTRRFTCSKICDREWRKVNREHYRSRANLSGLELGRKWWKGKKRGKTWNRGLSWSEEVKEKLRQANKRQKNKVLFKAGEAHPNWKGGSTKLVIRLRNIQKYKNWRNAVFKRDDFTCQECGRRGGRLNADHIKAFSVIIHKFNIRTLEKALRTKELWEISNGKTLCEPCHRKTPTFARNARYQVTK